MFIQRPQTTHVPRHYTQTQRKTGTRNVDKENAGALPSKTPSKGVLKGGMLVPNTAKPLGRGKDEKGKGKEDDIAPKRLFASTSQSQSQSQFIKPSKSFGNLPLIKSKTPAKTVRTPAPPKTKTKTNRQVIATPLPSASKPRRSRQSITPSILQIDKVFTTPSARNWEEGGSFDDLVEGVQELGLGVMEEEELDGEVEYMPPRSEPLPHIPIGAIDCVAHEFKVFNTLPVLWQFRPSGEVAPPPPFEVPSLELPEPCNNEELEEPMFRRPKAPQPIIDDASITARANAPRATPTSRLTGSRLLSTIPSRANRPTLSTSRPIQPTSRPTQPTSRPVTSAPTNRATPSSSRFKTPTLANKPSTLSLKARLVKQTSNIHLKPPGSKAPVQDLSHLIEDLPDVDISLDFGLDF